MYSSRGGGGGGGAGVGGGGGVGAAAERNDMGNHGHGDTAPDGYEYEYEYEVKRQRLLHGGSAMFSSYYQNQAQSQSQSQHQNQIQNPYTSSSSTTLHSSIAASLSSYLSSAPSPQHGGGGSGAGDRGGGSSSASGMFSSYQPGSRAGAASPPNPNLYSSSGSGFNPNFTCPSPTHLSSAGHGPNPSHLNSSSYGNSGLNHNYLSSSSASAPRNISHRHNNTSAGSPAMMNSYAGGSNNFSPFRGQLSPTRLGFSHSHSHSYRHQQHHYQHHHSGASPPPPPLPMPMERRSPRMLGSPPMMHQLFFRGPVIPPSRNFPVVRLRGLPFNCTEGDVCDFFRGLDVVDVLLTHKHGRFSGEAYCVFAVPIQVDLALRRNKQNMGQRYIEVFRSKKHEYYMAVTGEVSDREKSVDAPAPLPSSKTSDKDQMEHTGILKLRGLPFSASKKDVVEFFKGFDIKNEHIHFVVHSDGRATGEAFAEFDGPGESKQAMSRDKMMLGSRYVELFPSSRDEMAKATGRHRK